MMAASKPTFRVCFIFGLCPFIPYYPSGRGDNVALQLLAAHRAVENADDLLTPAGTEVPDPQHTLAVHGDLQETILSRVRIESSEIIVVSATEGTGLTASRSTLYDVPEPLLRYDMLFGPLFTRPDDVSVVTHSIYSPGTGP